jgi:hypothetical protein
MTEIAAVDLGLQSAEPNAPATDADRVAQELAQLKADSEFVRRHVQGSHETADQINKLIERMHRPAPGSVTFAADIGLSAAHIEEIRRNDRVSQEIYAEAARMRAALMRDPAWSQKFFNNDHEARRTSWLLSSILSRPVALRR